MGTNFDAAELNKIKWEAADAELKRLLHNPYGELLDSAEKVSILAVARHLREQTLREAVAAIERFDDESIYNAYASDCVTVLQNLAASARETGGKPTLEQSAARLHDKYGDALAKLDDGKEEQS